MTKPLLVLFTALQLASAQQPAPGSAASLIGRWRSVKTSKGGIGAVYYFQADGKVDFSPGAIVDMPYRVEGDPVIFPPGATNGPEIKFTLSLPSDRVLRLTMLGHATEYQRQGVAPDPRDPLLGEWLGSQEMDGRQMPEEMFFYPGGRSLLLILFTTERGRYSATNGRLMATFGGRVGLEGTFDVTDGVLSINRSGGRITKLARY